MTQISIIIPVYNKAAAISRCLDSILSQSFQDFECILIDDGSTDDSSPICDQYAATDRRISVIHKKNGGASSARNAGIDIACGKYLLFCDADDTVPSDALKNLLAAMESEDCQLVVGDFNYLSVDIQKNTLLSKKSYARSYQKIITKNIDSLYSFWCSNNMHSSCGKLYLRSIIEQHQLRFNTDLIVLEDYAFVISYLEHCQMICMIPEVVYNYIILKSEPLIQRRSRKDFLFDVLTVANCLEDYLTNAPSSVKEKFLALSIYPTLRKAYDFLWAIETPTLQARRKKYRLIKQAINSVTFQKMLPYQKHSFDPWDLRCLKSKSLSALLVLNAMRKIRSFLFKSHSK